MTSQFLLNVDHGSDTDLGGVAQDISDAVDGADLQAVSVEPFVQHAAEPGGRYVMCPPKYLSTRIPNNVWMSQEKVDIEKALRQYSRLKNIIEALEITVLEIPPTKGCQDQTYVANVGVAIEPYIILANYKAPGRDCEVEPARAFFEQQGYQCVQPPFHFEGEADLKKYTDEIYFGGWGLFTDPRALKWIADLTGRTIVPIHEINKEVYHLDCSLLVVDETNLLVAAEGIDAQSLKTLKSMAKVTLTPPEILTTGITNAALVRRKQLVLSGTFNPEMPDYQKAMKWMNCTFDDFGYTVVFLDVDEFDKSGADLSCCIFHLDFEATPQSLPVGQTGKQQIQTPIPQYARSA